MLNNSLDKLNFRTKVDTKLSKIATVGVNISGTYSKTERPKNNFIDFYRTPSFLPVYHNAYSTDLTGYTGFARGSHFNNIMTPTAWMPMEIRCWMPTVTGYWKNRLHLALPIIIRRA